MTTLAYLVLALLAAASAAPESRIVGGTPTSIEEFPYIVALTYFYPGPGITIQRCVGGLISSWHVLTSGFCFTGANLDNMSVRAGSTNSLSGGTVSGVGQVIKHPDFVSAPRSNDVGVVFLRSPLGISSVIDVMYLPPQGTYIPDGYDVKVVSWGFESLGGTQLELLKTVTLNKIGLADCAAQFDGSEDVEISDSVICAAAEGRGTCRGDSGAPMVIGQVLVGLSSFFEDCSDSYPSVFTRVDRYSNWILEVATAPSSDGLGIRSRPMTL